MFWCVECFCGHFPKLGNKLKVLDSQCTKLRNDPEGKAVVLKAFRKLIDRGYAVFYEDLSVDQKAKIDANPVQYYLPWRTVYKESVTSPCRPVMDASSKTPVLPDGRGGRCLNDLVMKGKISTLNLINMLLRIKRKHNVILISEIFF